MHTAEFGSVIRQNQRDRRLGEQHQSNHALGLPAAAMGDLLSTTSWIHVRLPDVRWWYKGCAVKFLRGCIPPLTSIGSW